MQLSILKTDNVNIAKHKIIKNGEIFVLHLKYFKVLILDLWTYLSLHLIFVYYGIYLHTCLSIYETSLQFFIVKCYNKIYIINF